MRGASSESIVITGLGCMLPGADTPEALWERLSAGDSAIKAYENEHIQTRLIPLFGHIDASQRAEAVQAVPFKLRRYSTPSSQWGVKAARDAMARAGLDLETVPEGRRGIFTAQGDYMYPSLPSFSGGLNSAAHLEAPDLVALTREFLSPRGVDPFVSIKGLANNLLAIAALSFGLRGDCCAFVQDDSAFLGALRAADFSLRHGYCDIALVICAGSYNEAFTLTELYQMGRLSQGHAGAASMRPFDAKRDGVVLAEGAAAFLLERHSGARARKATPLAVLSGFGAHLQAEADEEAHGYARCAERALAASGISLQAVDGIVAHGRSETEADLREAALLRRLLADAPDTPITCATAITGLVPACPLEMIAALGALGRGELFPVPHLEDPLCRSLALLRRPLKRPLRHLLALSAHATGWHTAIHLSHPEALPA